MASPAVHWRALRRDVARVVRTARGLGTLPGFILIGGQRCGTTAVFHQLRRHPAVGDPLRKETHFFDANLDRGERWYRAHFPTPEEMAASNARVTGEASPSYLFHPDVPARVQRLLPDARFIVLLRDPVIRAWSQWSLARSLHDEPLSFEAAVAAEPERLARALERKDTDPKDRGADYRRVSYLARGDYAPQLRRWFDIVGRDRVLVLVSEEFFADPAREFRKIEAFLELPVWDAFPGIEQKYAKGGGGRGMSGETTAQLREHFAPMIAETEGLLGRSLPWPH